MYMFQRSRKKQKDKLWSYCQKRLQEFRQLQQQQAQQLILGDHWARQPLPPHCGQTIARAYDITNSTLMGTTENLNPHLHSQQQQHQQSNCHHEYFPMNSASPTPPDYTRLNSSMETSYQVDMEIGSLMGEQEEMILEQDWSETFCAKCVDVSTDNDDYKHLDCSNCSEATETCPISTDMRNNNHNTNRGETSPAANSRQDTVAGTHIARRQNYSDFYSNQQMEVNRKSPFLNNNNNNNDDDDEGKTNSTMKELQQAQSTMTSTLTATAANMFRRCCRGRNSLSTDSSICESTLTDDNAMRHILNMNNNNNNNSSGKSNKIGYNLFQQNLDELSAKKLFLALTKKLEKRQLNTLCGVVEKVQGTHQTSDCVLVRRESIGGEEPNVIACRLFLWPDLKMASELKRIPTCPNGGDKVYVCCNLDHWNRILETETPPPPYQQPETDRLRPEDHAPSENLKDGGDSPLSDSTTDLRVQIPESFTTNGDERSSQSFGWCQIDYWELSKRVGARFKAKSSIIRIYSEGSGDMCLKTLAKECSADTVSVGVKKTRNQIGLGIILSQEADGVWLYNRSAATIFVHSPTLTDECCCQVFKVPPGRCIYAFDEKRARMQEQMYLKQRPTSQGNRIDPFSMKISFVKGWGPYYHRPNITNCNCWLEVLFPRR